MSKLSEKDRRKIARKRFCLPQGAQRASCRCTSCQEAVARFDQVEDVTNKERDEAWKRIQKAAKKFDVELEEKDWRDLFKRNGRSVPKRVIDDGCSRHATSSHHLLQIITFLSLSHSVQSVP